MDNRHPPYMAPSFLPECADGGPDVTQSLGALFCILTPCFAASVRVFFDAPFSRSTGRPQDGGVGRPVWPQALVRHISALSGQDREAVPRKVSALPELMIYTYDKHIIPTFEWRRMFVHNFHPQGVPFIGGRCCAAVLCRVVMFFCCLAGAKILATDVQPRAATYLLSGRIAFFGRCFPDTTTYCCSTRNFSPRHVFLVRAWYILVDPSTGAFLF